MRRFHALLAALTLAGCGGAANDPVAPEPATTEALDRASGPGIAVTAAPGVAFNYRYAFRLPAQRIATVQEQHAQACEKLGVDRCRITGMRYRLVNQTDIQAMLSFKLEPAIARNFGKAGVQAVVGADGMLIDSEISGEDAGAAIGSADRNETRYRDDLARIESQLARPGLGDAERTRLRAEAEELRAALRSLREDQAERKESLARTPVAFHYASGDLIPGFDTRSPVRQALERAGNNFIEGVTILFVIIVTLLPWLAVGGRLWWLYLNLSRRVARRQEAGASPQEN